MLYPPGMFNRSTDTRPANLIDTLRSTDVNDMDDITLHELRAALHALERQIVDALEERGTGFIS